MLDRAVAKDVVKQSLTAILRKNPVCPYPPLKAKGLRRLLKDYCDYSKEQKNKLFHELRAQKNGMIKRKSKVFGKYTHSAGFSTATFASKVRTTVCADMGSAITQMDERPLTKLERTGAEFQVRKLNPPCRLNMEADNLDGTENVTTPDRAGIFDTQLDICYGSALFLRVLRWLLASQLVGEPSLGCPLLDALGLDFQKVLSADVDRHGGTVDVLTI